MKTPRSDRHTPVLVAIGLAVVTTLTDAPPGRAAIATRSPSGSLLAEKPHPAPISADDPAMRTGAELYKDNCAACHRDSGAGETQLFPRLVGNPAVLSSDPAAVIYFVLYGTLAVSRVRLLVAPAMPRFDWRLSDRQVAAVLTYIRNSWGNRALPVSASRVAAQRKLTPNQ